jgi:hypothetical protein
LRGWGYQKTKREFPRTEVSRETMQGLLEAFTMVQNKDQLVLAQNKTLQ